jgi:DNA (cytosine-5)-methyltransferase 1
MTLTIGSLFSGVGGLELGLEWAGLGPVLWQAESDPFCRSVLARHWPDATRYSDVRSIDASTPRVDVLCGGFPCQDISDAGKRAGIDGERSGLWSEFARVIGLLRPRFVVVENVSALLGRGMGRVLGDLSELGYDAEWSTLRASDVGASHRRERVFVVAYPDVGGCGGERLPKPSRQRGARGRLLDGPGAARRLDPQPALVDAPDDPRRRRGGAMGDAAGAGLEERSCERGDARPERATLERASLLADAPGERREGPDGRERTSRERWAALEPERYRDAGSVGRSPQPRLGRVPDGIPHRVDRWPSGPGEGQADWEPPRTIEGRSDNRPARLRALGNAVVPQCAEVVGRRVLALAGAREPS